MHRQEERSRRHFLKNLSYLGAAGLALPTADAQSRGTRDAPKTIPVEHVLISVNENRSFDHYYGYAPFVGGYGVPPGYSQPDGSGRRVVPIPFSSTSTPNPAHDWGTIHSEWD